MPRDDVVGIEPKIEYLLVRHERVLGRLKVLWLESLKILAAKVAEEIVPVFS